jgi:hypothetical protein
MGTFGVLPASLLERALAATHPFPIASMNPARSPRRRPTHLRVVPQSPAPASIDEAPTWIEVSLSWGTTPLHVQHLTRACGYVLADALQPNEEGYVVAARPGEPPRLPILVERDGATFAQVPDEATVTLVVDGRVLFRRDALRAGLLEGDELHPGATLFRIDRGRRCRFEARGLVVQLEGVEGEAAPPNLRPRLTRTDWIVLAISAVLHVAAITALVVTNPSWP